MSILIKTRLFLKSLNPRSISTFTYLYQEPQLAEPLPSSSTTSSSLDNTSSSPLPPNPFSSTRNLNPFPSSDLTNSIIPIGFQGTKILEISRTNDVHSLKEKFADWITLKKWNEMKQTFEMWIRCFDKNGERNKPDVDLYNHYLRANLESGVSAGELIDLIAQMEDCNITPNTASYNIVLEAMFHALETVAAEKLLERMLLSGKNSLPDDESYNLVIQMLFLKNQIDAALKYLDMTLKSGYMVSMGVFTECVRSCVNAGRLDTLVSIIRRCKEMDQNKALCPSWNMCNYIAEIALQDDDSKLAFYALEFLAKWIIRGENNRQGPPILLSVDEGLIVSALGTAGRTYNPTLLDASWQILQRSLRKKSAPSAESYLGKIYGHASLGHLQKAFHTLNELESVHGSSTMEAEDLFSPFTSLYPLVAACSKNGFESLDTVYFQLESLSKAHPPYKSVAALNCVVLGCANIWDLNRAYQTFEAISSSFGLTPNIHSYNALMYAFGRLKQTFEASRVFDHLISLGVKPNATSYAMLVDAHLINRDAKAALSVIDDMVTAGFKPSKVMLKKVRRRCVREFDYESDDRVEDLAKKFKIRMGTENRKGILFNIEYGANYP
ncbi:hypothetical protein AQUCO_00200821v1 [Aquilegia coerulea]|uniref:Pentacotripeptide-repeat region of PRORP domain-containing protein n=1 Tax=Aquilegia coerulea TaxID=218851 RepID=A0A2G5F505_AQUCA|nr:hypothetical protein AQUCO_00200821v1 [Aquilegia coerulea]PIA63047.1 hypothetical protein AQUCO_00200821v1 [Aquilegia coerulea]PIA63048.1 hypothetical protein AQUCO_00200821v1 [Aquilegia coerulea]PIA63049.1 hypothetical protein AQUCO_00200821v1 [Aquilegia coerulea]